MKMKSFLIPALALALAGCANEELETIGSGTIPAVPSGQTILFSNNTALTIGDADGVQTRAMGWTEVTDKVNSACWLEMDVKPTPSGNDVYIKSGEEEVYNRPVPDISMSWTAESSLWKPKTLSTLTYSTTAGKSCSRKRTSTYGRPRSEP